jgi:hypothetical protein
MTKVFWERNVQFSITCGIFIFDKLIIFSKNIGKSLMTSNKWYQHQKNCCFETYQLKISKSDDIQ